MTIEMRTGNGIAGLAEFSDQSIDHCITDPPYDEHTQRSVRSGRTADGWKGRVISSELPLDFDPMTREQAAATCIQLARVVRRWVLIFTSTEFAHVWREEIQAAGIRYVRTAAWIKLGGAPNFSGDRPAQGFEEIVIGHVAAGRMRWSGGGKQGLWRCSDLARAEELANPETAAPVYEVPIAQNRGGIATEPRVHKTQKPVRLMRMLVEDFTDPGESIVDPYAGSGTTGVAIGELNALGGPPRHFLGWEIDPKMADIARKRLDQSRSQVGLFEEQNRRSLWGDDARVQAVLDRVKQGGA